MAYFTGPNIVTDELKFVVDAGSQRSYSGSGTTVNTLVETVSGTLYNGVGFSSANGGAFDFDGVDDYIQFSSIPTGVNPGNDGAFSFGGWINTSNESGFQQWIRLSAYFFYLKTDQSYVRIYYGGTPLDFAFTFSHGEWINLYAVVDRPSNTIRIYKNGIQVAVSTSATATGAVGTGSFNIGGVSGERLENLIGPISYYNKALSVAEISQNYNAQKSRFGL
tara:strand:+ start:213 stop:875 length:663 start_codon:yes stop_codon:yes gene_type:complete